MYSESIKLVSREFDIVVIFAQNIRIKNDFASDSLHDAEWVLLLLVLLFGFALHLLLHDVFVKEHMSECEAPLVPNLLIRNFEKGE